MLKWLFTLVVALAILSALTTTLQRWGLGRLPGDFRVRLGGRLLYIPLTTTVILSLLLTALVRLM